VHPSFGGQRREADQRSVQGNRVEEDVKPDLKVAIMRALMGRDPEWLEQVKEAVA
jgi:hypothetical protein